MRLCKDTLSKVLNAQVWLGSNWCRYNLLKGGIHGQAAFARLIINWFS